MPSFYHIGLSLPAGVDPNAIQNAVSSQSLDWLRYSSSCYVVWTNADAVMLAGALMTVPGMRAGNVLVNKIDVSDTFGFLPQWAWAWLQKDRSKDPAAIWALPGAPPPPPFLPKPPNT